MHVVVFGVGAIGGFYGSLLARYTNQLSNKQHQVSFIARGKTFEALKNKGIKLLRDENTVVVQEKINNIFKNYSDIKASGLPQVNAVLLCVKSKDTVEAVASMKDYLDADTYVVSVQNGVENEERIASVLGIERVVGCLTNVAAENVEPGVYLQREGYSIVCGELEANKNKTRLKDLEKMFLDADINIKISDTIFLDMWTKLVWNAAFNPISALYELEIGDLIANPKHKETIFGIMNETKAVAHAQGIMIRDDVAEFQFKRTDVPEWANFKTSMLQDILAGKAIELEELLGIVIRKGKEFKVKTPYAESVYYPLKEKISAVATMCKFTCK